MLISIQPLGVAGYQVTGNFVNQSGKVNSMDVFKGKYLVLDVMATWCDPCRVQMLHLKDVEQAIAGNKNATLFSMSMDSNDTLPKLQSFMQKFNATWDFGLDYKGQLMDFFSIKGYPTTILLSPEGKILHKWLGLTPANDILREMDKYLAIPGSFGRSLHLNYLLSTLTSNPLFFIFLGLIWIFILVIIVQMVKGVKSKNVEPQENEKESN